MNSLVSLVSVASLIGNDVMDVDILPTKPSFSLSKPILKWFDSVVQSDDLNAALDVVQRAVTDWTANHALIDDPSKLLTHWHNGEAPISADQRIFYRREMLCCSALYLMDYYFEHKMTIDLYDSTETDQITQFHCALRNVIQSIDMKKLQDSDFIILRRWTLAVIAKTSVGLRHSAMFDLFGNYFVDKMELMNALKSSDLVLRRRIGSGTFGVVFKVDDIANSEIYALKSFNSKSDCQIEERFLNRLKQQTTAPLGRALSIAHVQRNDEINCERTSSFLLDYINGVQCSFRDVSDYIPDHPGGIIGFINQFGSTLDNLIREIQVLNISHSDISPNNVMYNPDTFRFYLIDWGSATDMNEQQDLMDFYCMYSYL